MSDGRGYTIEQQEALQQLQRYLADDIAPMIFTQTLDSLFTLQPRLIASQIVAWVASLHNTSADLATADYLFHAAKKLHLLGELELIPLEQAAGCVEALRPHLLSACPEQDRAGLAGDLDNLHLSQGAESTAGIGHVHRPQGQEVARGPSVRKQDAGPGGTAAGADGSVSEGLLKGLGKVNQLLSRFAAQADGTQPAGGAAAANETLAARIVAEAADHAADAGQLDGSLAELRNQGLQISPDTIVRLLARNLPDWAPPRLDSEEAGEPQGAVRAMRQMITMSKTSGEKAHRFQELVASAVDEFNKGSLGRAVTMVDLAERMAGSDEVEASVVTSAHSRAYDQIDQKVLRQYVEDDDKHHLLRRVLRFFPHFAPAELFAELEMSDSRERRRFLLMVLNAMGEATREAALEALEGGISGEASYPWFFERNLVYLLRTTKRAGGETPDREIDVLIHMSDLKAPMPLVREALATLGQIQHDRAITALVARVSELEDALVGSGQLPHDEDDMRSLLDSVAAVLARNPSKVARRCVVAHGVKRQPQLGDTYGRLSKLAGQDLSEDRPAVDRIVRALRDELPTKVLGLTMVTGKKAKGVERIIKALSGTDTPAVRDVLREISESFSGQNFAAEAAKTLAQLGSVAHVDEAPSAALTGDLELFGLPSLLQNLSDSQLSGTLTVLDPTGQTAAAIELVAGFLMSAEVDQLHGETAIYQLMERPVRGRFIFVREDSEAQADGSVPGAKPVAPMLFEGIRRYDEFMRAASLAPDDAIFKTTGQKPTNLEDEPNTDLVRDVWQRLLKGASPAVVEGEMPVDSYRVRRLVEHWVTEGSLEAQA